MTEWTGEDVEELAHGLRVAAGEDDDPSDTPGQAWRQVARRALEVGEIEVTPEQFERAWRCVWQRSFMGGNYSLDAKAVLAAIAEEVSDAEPVPSDSES